MTTDAELRADLKATQGRLAAAEERAANAAEYRWLIPGHPAAEHAYIAARRGANDWWELVDGCAGLFPPRYWDGAAWQEIRSDVPTAERFRWVLDDAEKHGPELAQRGREAHDAWGADRMGQLGTAMADAPAAGPGGCGEHVAEVRKPSHALVAIANFVSSEDREPNDQGDPQ